MDAQTHISQINSNDWRWQIRNAIKAPDTLRSSFTLTAEEKKGLSLLSSQGLPLQITPHFLELMDKKDPNCPLRKQVIPTAKEAEEDPALLRDPLGEEDHEVVPHLVHRYPDRVLLLVTDRCASYCRFCTRKRWVGQGPTPTTQNFRHALDYIANNSQIREVIISGGDGLVMADSRLESILGAIRKISHVQIIRIHSRMLAFAPMRVTRDLVQLLKKYQPLYLVVHFNHEREISNAAQKAIEMLVDNGIPVLNQGVLLKGINDTRDDLVDLFRKLVQLRVRPYYLHQCDAIFGSSQFRVNLDKAIKLYSSLRGHVSGLCLPTFVIDIPGGYGKVPLHQSPIIDRDGDSVLLRGFDGETAYYPLN